MFILPGVIRVTTPRATGSSTGSSPLAIIILVIALLNYINPRPRGPNGQRKWASGKLAGATPRSPMRHFLGERAILGHQNVAHSRRAGGRQALPFFNRLLDTGAFVDGPTTLVLPVLLFSVDGIVGGRLSGPGAFAFPACQRVSGIITTSSKGVPRLPQNTDRALNLQSPLGMLTGLVVFFLQMRFLEHQDSSASDQQQAGPYRDA